MAGVITLDSWSSSVVIALLSDIRVVVLGIEFDENGVDDRSVIPNVEKGSRD